MEQHTQFYDRYFARTRFRITFTQRILVRGILQVIRRECRQHPPPLEVVELGCGKAWLASHLRAFGNVTALDSAADTIAANREQYPDIEFRQGDVTQPLPERDYFDVAVSMEVVEHIPYDHQAGLIETAWQALRPGGLFILTTPNKTTNKRLGVKGFQPVEDWLTIAEARNLVAARFTVEDVFTQVFRFRNRWLDALWKRLFYPVNMFIIQRLMRYSGRGKHIIVVARKPNEAAP